MLTACKANTLPIVLLLQPKSIYFFLESFTWIATKLSKLSSFFCSLACLFRGDTRQWPKLIPGSVLKGYSWQYLVRAYLGGHIRGCGSEFTHGTIFLAWHLYEGVPTSESHKIEHHRFISMAWGHIGASPMVKDNKPLELRLSNLSNLSPPFSK